ERHRRQRAVDVDDMAVARTEIVIQAAYHHGNRRDLVAIAGSAERYRGDLLHHLRFVEDAELVRQAVACGGGLATDQQRLVNEFAWDRALFEPAHRAPALCQ